MPLFRALRMLALISAALATAPIAASAQPRPKAANACFLLQNVENFNAPDDHTVYIRVGVKDVYRLDLMTDCLDISFRQSLALESLPANPWICSPLEATVISRDTGMHMRCPVKAIHKLAADEVAALPKRDRP